MKSAKFLWRISAATTPEAEDAVTELFGSTLENPVATYHNCETGASVVSVFRNGKFPRETKGKILAGLNRIKICGLEIGAGKIKITRVKREDWAESWKRHFKPVEIGDALLVKPSWSKKPPRKEQAVVILDPGLSFGTGQHPTTAFCLHQIAAAVCDRRNRHSQSAAAAKSFLDIGTGSGILAIAAAKLGCKPVRAFDFDPEAVRVARANARINRVHKKLHVERADVTKLSARPKRQFDLVCANLISNLLIAQRKKIAAQLNRGGILVLAGISKSEFADVGEKFAELGLKLVASKTEKEWQSGSFWLA
jgi:ribosomal protein L11 methyltransferase